MPCLSLFNSWVTHSILLFTLSSRLLAQAWATTFKSSYTDWYTITSPQNNTYKGTGCPTQTDAETAARQRQLSTESLAAGKRGECGPGQKYKKRRTLVTEPDITGSWVTCLQFKVWPTDRHRAVLWLLANMVTFCAQRKRDQTLQDFHEVFKRKR
jgi:hypothetical protein